MRPDENQPATNETPASKTGEEGIQAQAQSAMEPVDAGTGSLPDLRKASEELKTKSPRRSAAMICRWTRRSAIPDGNRAPPMVMSTFPTRTTTDHSRSDR